MPQTKYLGLIPWTKTLVFEHVCVFPSMKVHVYIYAPFFMLTHMYTPLGQGEPAYTS